jgi:hypothetical protein
MCQKTGYINRASARRVERAPGRGVSGEGECSLFTIEVVHMALILIDRDYTKQGYAQMAMPFTEPSMVAIPKAPSRKPRKASLKMMGWKSSWEKRTTGTPVIASVDT